MTKDQYTGTFRNKRTGLTIVVTDKTRLVPVQPTYTLTLRQWKLAVANGTFVRVK
jgi:hypothetical protein